MIRWIDELVQARADFAIETTLSGSWIEKSIAEWRASGYEVSLCFLKLDSADLAVDRVADRIAKGGHSIPEETIRRRFGRSLERLERGKSLVSRWSV